MNFVFIAGGSFQGKSLIALKLASKFNFSGVLTTDMLRNFLKIQYPEKTIFSTSTYKMTRNDLELQKEAVSSILKKQIEIYQSRGEKMIFEGMHFSDDFIKSISKSNYLKLFINNIKCIEERFYLKQKTRNHFSFENEVANKLSDTKKFEETSYYFKQNRINEIHSDLKNICLQNGFIEVSFEKLDDAINKCEALVKDYFLE